MKLRPVIILRFADIISVRYIFSGVDVMILKIFSPKKLAILTKILLSYVKKIIVFSNIGPIFSENLVKIPQTLINQLIYVTFVMSVPFGFSVRPILIAALQCCSSIKICKSFAQRFDQNCLCLANVRVTRLGDFSPMGRLLKVDGDFLEK
jgi:hypothetical protein